MLYLRVSFPWDWDFGQEDKAIRPELAMDEHCLPYIHRRTVIEEEKFDTILQSQAKAHGKWLDPWNRRKPLNKRVKTPSPESSSSEEEPPKPPVIQVQPPTPVPVVEEKKPEPIKKEETIIKPPELIQGVIRKGIYVKINYLKPIPEKRYTSVRCALVHNSDMLIDEKGNKCTFTTDGALPGMPYVIKLPGENVEEHVFYEEDSIFFIDIQFYMEKNKTLEEEIFLVFQLLIEEEQDVSHVMEVNLEAENLDKKKYKGFAWLLFPLFTSTGKLKAGEHEELIFSPPILKPPIDEKEVKKRSELLNFYVNWYTYDLNTYNDAIVGLDAQKEKRKKKRREKVKKLQRKRIQEFSEDKRPFIPNAKINYEDRPFEKGQGIDFYIDQARFLTDNCTITKVVFNVVNQSFDKFMPSQAGLPELDSMTYSPNFNFRQELRAPHFDPTLMAFISIETIDMSCGETKIVGYAAVNLFLNRATKKQPTQENDSNVILMNGAYQIPIYCQEPVKKRPFNLDRISKLDKIPCASLLIRINRAPMTDDNLRALNLNDVAQKDWEKTGLWIPAPPYSSGLYNNVLCDVRDSERELFVLRVTREDNPVMESAKKLISYEKGSVEDMSGKDISEWMDNKIKRTQMTDIIDLTYIAKYQPRGGFKVSVDGLHNVPDGTKPYVAFYSLNPPGELYKDIVSDISTIQLNTALNWSSPCNSPHYNEGFFTFKEIEFHKNMTILVDVRSVIFSSRGNRALIDFVGWAALPVFTPNGYVKSGLYQLPLIKGPIPRNIIDELQNNDPWPFLQDELKKKRSKLKLLEPTSVVIRLIDSQREGHFQIPYDPYRMDYRYIPKDKLGVYAYNYAVEDRLREKSKRLYTIAPEKAKPESFNDKITEAVVERFGIKHFTKK